VSGMCVAQKESSNTSMTFRAISFKFLQQQPQERLS
jgi:hypothetical protein